MKKYSTILLLSFFSALAVVLLVIKPQIPCINADHSAFGYNAYSIMQTGKDEYGRFLPVRFASFGDNKLPVIFYLIAPFTKLFGLNNFAIRLPVHLVGVLLPLVLFLLSYKLFKSKPVALITAFLASISPWIMTMARHVHEAPLATLLIALALYFFLLFYETRKIGYFIWFSCLNGLALFTYHIAKVAQPFFALWFSVYTFFGHKMNRSSKLRLVIIFTLPVLFFLYTELQIPPTRMNNLLFYKNPGFMLTIQQKRGDGGNRLLNNKVTEGVQVVTKNYLKYFSPVYLSFTGDTNPRFGYDGLGPISPIEYIFLLIGLYYLFQQKERYRWLIVSLLAVAPIPAALAWTDESITRNFLEIVPILVIIAYGVWQCYKTLDENPRKRIIIALCLSLFLFFRFTTWDLYFNHYQRRPIVIRANECGYDQLTQFVKDNYARFKSFYITREYGQPYIHLLYKLQYNPDRYHPQAHLTTPDKYGFGQVESFDKFIFHIPNSLEQKNAVYIGYPEELRNRPDFTKEDEERLKFITVEGETIFAILER